MTRMPVAGLILSLVLLLSSLAGWSARVVAQPDETIPSRFSVFDCPRGYEGGLYLGDCTLASFKAYSITVTDTSPTETTATTATDADGGVTFTTVPGPTSWSLEVGFPASYYFSCFDADGAYLFDGETDLIETTLAEGDALACRWYVIPEAGAGGQPGETIPSTFELLACPEGTTDPGSAAGCSPVGDGETAVTVYDILSSATTPTDANGTVTFLTAPGYTSFSIPVRGDRSYAYSCVDADGSVVAEGTTADFGLIMEDGDSLTCQWLITPVADAGDSAGTGNVSIQVFECPVAYDGQDYLADCTPGSDSDTAYLGGEGGGDERYFAAYLDASMTATFTDIPANRYSIGSGTTVSWPGGHVYLACFDVSSGTERFLFDGLRTVEDPWGAPWAISITVEPGGEYACRYYETPGDESAAGPAPGSDDDPADSEVGVQVFDCPEAYDGDDYAADCAPTGRPVGIVLNDGYRYDEATEIRNEAGAEGRAGFVDLIGGPYHLAIEDLSASTTIYWTCFDLEDGTERFDRDGFHNRITFFLGASADYTCRIYLTADGPAPPEAGTPGTVTVNILYCPEGYDGPDWATTCTEPVDNNRVAVRGSAMNPNDYSLDIVEGTATFLNVDPGPIGAVTDMPGHWTEQRGACVIGAGPVGDDVVNEVIEGDAGEGSVTLEDGDGATCVIYVTPISYRA